MPDLSILVRRCTWVWMLLVGLTGVTYAVGEIWPGGVGPSVLVLVIAVLKAWFVAEHFMGLRGVTGFWRPLIGSYLVLLGIGIALAFADSG